MTMFLFVAKFSPAIWDHFWFLGLQDLHATRSPISRQGEMMKRKCSVMIVRGLRLPRSSPLPLFITPHPLCCALFVRPFPTLPAFAIFTVIVSCPHLITERGSSWRRGKRGALTRSKRLQRERGIRWEQSSHRAERALSEVKSKVFNLSFPRTQ